MKHFIPSINNLKTGKYQHYKSGNLYQVLGTALHTETLEEMVIYKALYSSEKFAENQLWIRPQKMFLEYVIHNGHSTPRFKLIEKNSIHLK